MTPARREILRLLADGEMRGLQMVRASKKLHRGTVYVHLSNMLGDGLVAFREDEQLRLVYRLTDAGKAAAIRLYEVSGDVAAGMAVINSVRKA